VAEEQNSNRFPAHTWHQSSLDGFLSHQAHRPPGEALGWVAADHSNDALLLSGFQQRLGARSLFFVESPFQSAFPVAMADLADRLRRQRHHPRNTGRTHALGQLQKRDRPQHDPYCTPPLSSLPNSFLSLVVTSMRNAARAIHRVCSKPFQDEIVLLEILQAVKDLV
jgi:hypothetical protein